MAGPAFAAAAWPVSTKMPVPMIAPMPSAMRFTGPSTRRSPCRLPPTRERAPSIDLVRNSDMAASVAARRARLYSATFVPARGAVGAEGRRGGPGAGHARRRRHVGSRSRYAWSAVTIAAAIGEPAAERVDVPRGEVRELGALGVRRADARADVDDGQARAAVAADPRRAPPTSRLRALPARSATARRSTQPAAELERRAARGQSTRSSGASISRALGVARRDRPCAGAPPAAHRRARAETRDRTSAAIAGTTVPASVGLVHHVARIEAGLDQVAAERRRVAALVRQKPHDRRAIREQAAHRRGEVDRFPPAIGRQERQRPSCTSCTSTPPGRSSRAISRANDAASARSAGAIGARDRARATAATICSAG